MVGSITEENSFVEYVPEKKKKKSQNGEEKDLKDILKEKLPKKK